MEKDRKWDDPRFDGGHSINYEWLLVIDFTVTMDASWMPDANSLN